MIQLAIVFLLSLPVGVVIQTACWSMAVVALSMFGVVRIERWLRFLAIALPTQLLFWALLGVCVYALSVTGLTGPEDYNPLADPTMWALNVSTFLTVVFWGVFLQHRVQSWVGYSFANHA